MSRNNTLTFDTGSTFYVDVGGIFMREDKPGSLRPGNTVRIQGVAGIFRVVEVSKPQKKLQIEVEKIHGDALLWVRDRKGNVWPVEAIAHPRPNDPMDNPITEYYVDGQWIDAASVTETDNPALYDVSQARARNPKMVTPTEAKQAIEAGELVLA